MKKHWFKIVVLIAIIIAVAAATLANRYYFEKETPVETAEARLGDLEEIVKMSGYVDAEETEIIISNAEGIIDRLNIEEGDKVKKGEKLCVVRSPALRAKLLVMKAERITAKENMLIAPTGSERSMAQARYNFIKANIADLEETMDPEAHISGDVIKVEVQDGSKVVPGMKLFFLADMDHPVVKARMEESDVQKVKAGQPVWITGDFLSGRSLQGKISKISKFVDKEIGTYVETTCMIFNPKNLLLKFGAYADVKVITARKKKVLLIPKEALIFEEGEYVFEVRNRRAYRLPVRIGIMGERYVEVLSGLREGDRVATEGSLNLFHGAKVKY
ncbi:MAG: efflux RND transporter periplasmic adaptor subunit [Candidatus Margulisiibacteriota bacterium]